MGSNVPLSSPVAISTNLTASVSSLNHQGSCESVASYMPISNTPNTAVGSHSTSGINDFLQQLTTNLKGINIGAFLEVFTVVPLSSVKF